VSFLIEARQKAAEFAEANAAALLTAGGVVGTVATAVLTGRAALKAAEIITAEEVKSYNAETGDVKLLDTKEKVKLVWPQFLLPAATGSATVASIIMANRVSAQKAAALAAAYGLAERNLSEYKDKVSEKLTGPKKTAIDDEIAQDRVNRTSGHEVVIVGDGEVLCFDEPTGRYFRSTMENLKSAVNATNAEILNHDWARATFFYEEIGLPATTWTDDVGWNRDRLMDLKYTTVMSPDNKPCIAIDFTVLPIVEYIPKHF
jgi:hypothetical protein